MSGQCLRQGRPVAADEHHATQPVGGSRHQVVDVGALEQATGHPHDVLVGGQAGAGGVRVGGLGVVDPADAVDRCDLGDAVRLWHERAQAGAHRPGRDPVRPGQGCSREGVGDEVRGGARRVAAQVVEGAELGCGGATLLDEGPVGEHVVDDTELGRPGDAEGEADGPASLLHVGVLDEPPGAVVLDVVDAGDLGVRVDLPLGGGVLVERAVPVDVVGSDVEAGRGPRRQGVRPVQLEARQLDGDDVVGLRVHDRLEHRGADVAGAAGPQPGRPQDRGEHLHGGRLAVGAGHGQPRRRPLTRPQPPRELHLAPHRDAGRGRGGQQRLVGPPPGRGDDEVEGGVGKGGHGIRPVAEPGPQDVEDPPRSDITEPGAGSVASTTVTSAPRSSRASAAANPLTPRPVTRTRSPAQSASRWVRPTARVSGAAAHPAPTTHSA